MYQTFLNVYNSIINRQKIGDVNFSKQETEDLLLAKTLFDYICAYNPSIVSLNEQSLFNSLSSPLTVSNRIVVNATSSNGEQKQYSNIDFDFAIKNDIPIYLSAVGYTSPATDFSAFQTFKFIRNSIVHGKYINFKSNNASIFAFLPTDKNRFNYTLLISQIRVEKINKILLSNHNNQIIQNEQNINLIFTPRLFNPIENETELENYLSKFKLINICSNSENNIENCTITDVLNLINTYNSLPQNRPELEQFFNKNYNFAENDCNFSVKSPENLEFLKKYLQNNKNFFAYNAKNKTELQADYISKVVNNFFGFNFLNQKQNAEIGVPINYQNCQMLLNTFFNYIIPSSCTANNLSFFSYELKIVLTVFFTYYKIVYSKFWQAFQFRNVNLTRNIKSEKTNEVADKLRLAPFAGFTIQYPNKKDKPSSQFINEDKKVIINAIRNAYAHNSIFILVNNFANYKNQTLLFKDLDIYQSNKQNKNVYFRTVKTGCDQLLELFENDVFNSYSKQFNHSFEASEEIKGTCLKWMSFRT